MWTRTLDRVDEEIPENFYEIVRGNKKIRRKELHKKRIGDLKIEMEFTMPTILEEEEQAVQYDDLQCVFMKMSSRVAASSCIWGDHPL